MRASTKKEVSCRAFDVIFYYTKPKNIDLNSIIAGVPYDLSYLLNRSERVEWWVWCKIISNLRPYFSYTEFEEMGVNLIKGGSYIIGMLFAFILFSTNKVARLLNKQAFKLVESTFSCIQQKTEYINKNNVKVTGHLDTGYEFCPEFWIISKGAWKQMALQIGHKGVTVNLLLKNEKAIFEVSWDKAGIGFKIRKAICWIFNIRKAFLELTESHQTLLNQYQDLDQSKKLLQKQTTQLKTAHEISMSIRQSLNIEDTIKAIVYALVKEASFSFVSIQLFNDIDENEIDIKTQIGRRIESVSSVQQKIIIDGKTIGELILQPDSEMDYRESNELLEYLTPVINIAIHDALVLRAIVDYRDNLEQKVLERTFELQNARDKLAETIQLLQAAHQSQNRFFTNISHEFRTPLTLILGPAKQLLEQLNDEETKAKADLIHRSAGKLNRLVNELLDLSRIEAGEMKLKASPVNLVSVVKEMSLSFYSLAERKNITFKFNCDKKEIIAYIDKDKVDKILSNVLSNAFKFTPEGGKVEVEIKPTPGLSM